MATPWPSSGPDLAVELRRRLEESLWVQAAAGTGKTHALTQRALAYLEAGEDVRTLAVVTFLRAAAEELRSRIRGELSRLAAQGALWAQRALVDLPLAPMGTLHALAHRLLRELGPRYGWDPATRLVSEAQARRLRAEVLRDYLARRLSEDPGPYERAVRLGLRLEAKDLEAVAQALVRWEAQVPPSPPTPGEEACAPLLAQLQEVLGVAQKARCSDPQDSLWQEVRALGAWHLRLSTSAGFSRVCLACLLPLPSPHRLGNQRRWQPSQAVARLREGIEELRNLQARLREQAGEAIAGQLLSWLSAYALHYRQALEERGWVDHDEVIRQALALLREVPQAREEARRRYRRVLVDEMQDTDPRQVALLEVLAEGSGRLFAVGDVYQSVYRFRGADVDTYREQLAKVPPSHRLVLTVSRRSRLGVCQAVHAMCGPLLGPDLPRLVPAAPEPPGLPAPLWVVGPSWEAGHPISRERQREEEAQAVAAFLAREALGRWRVRGEGEKLRPLRPGDVAVLLRRRSHAMTAYAQALARYGVPAVAGRDLGAAHSPVGTEVLRLYWAVAQPRSPVRVVAALRTGLLGASDEDLLRAVQAGVTWDLAAWQEGGERRPHLPPAVVRGMDLLARVATQPWSAAQQVEELADALQLGAASVVRGGAQGWEEAARMVVALVALAERHPHLPLREILEMVEREELREEEEVWEALAGHAHARAQEGEGAVRLITVHEAKGLEFPVVVLADLWARRPATRTGLFTRRLPGGARELALCLATPWGDPLAQSPGAAQAMAWEEKAQAEEEARLWYVALTRARDVLILADARSPEDPPPDSFRDLVRRAAPLPGTSLADDLRGVGLKPKEAYLDVAAMEGASSQERLLGEELVRAGEERKRQACRRREAARPVWRPSRAVRLGLAETGMVDPEDPDAEEEGQGDAARQVGRAVHAALAALLAPGGEGKDIENLAAQACAREGVPQAAEEVAQLCRAALDIPVVQRALASFTRATEVELWGDLEEGLVLGRVDLMFAEGESWILVDFKTDHLSPGQKAAFRHAQDHGHLEQLGLYRRVAERALTCAQVKAYVVYLRTGEAVALGEEAQAE